VVALRATRILRNSLRRMAPDRSTTASVRVFPFTLLFSGLDATRVKG